MAQTKVISETAKDDLSSKKRVKSKDVPFPVVYFGFILGFLALNWQTVYQSFPRMNTITFHRDYNAFPTFEATKLPLFATLVVCPLLGLWRRFLKTNVFAHIAKSWAGLVPGTNKYEKFCEQAWLAFHYTVATSWGYYVLRNKSWWPPVVSHEAQLAVVASNEDRLRDHSDDQLRLYYALQLGFYTLEMVTLVSSQNNKRSDAVMYLIHHLYTVFLMAGSWLTYNQRIGTLVLILHDVGDIFLPIGKCYSYAEEHIKATRTNFQYNVHKTIGMSFFVMFVITFAIPRLILYGLLVFRGFSYRWYDCCGYDEVLKQCGECTMGSWWNVSLLTTLGLLYPLHVYWFYLIVKMAVKLLFSGDEATDVRSDDEDEADDNRKKHKSQ